MAPVKLDAMVLVIAKSLRKAADWRVRRCLVTGGVMSFAQRIGIKSLDSKDGTHWEKSSGDHVIRNELSSGHAINWSADSFRVPAMAVKPPVAINAWESKKAPFTATAPLAPAVRLASAQPGVAPTTVVAADIPKTVAALAPRVEGDAIDDNIVKHGKLFASAGRVQLYQHGVADEALPQLAPLAGAADRALNVLEFILERPLDTDTLGTPVRIYISPDIKGGHVWRGYRHPADPKAAIFLPPQRAADSVQNKSAVDVHELTHLMTWRYHSHTLREGLADYLAFLVRPGTDHHAPKTNPPGDFSIGEVFKSLNEKVSDLLGRNQASPTIKARYANALAQISNESASTITERLGTTQPPPDNVYGFSYFRSAYYQASYHFVDHLIKLGGLERFLQVYASENPEALYMPLYGKTREQLVAEALDGAVVVTPSDK